MPRKPPRTPEQERFLEERMPEGTVFPSYDRATLKFDQIATAYGVLCVECRACGKRSMLTKENCPHLRPGNMARIMKTTFRCSRHGCGSTDVNLYAGCDREEGEMFVAGDPIEGRYLIPEKARWE